jgi:hypothetical protein
LISFSIPAKRGWLAWLLLLAHFGKEGKPETVVPKISQEMLAEMIGTTRSRVSFFMNRFRELGFIDYDAGNGLQVHSSLLKCRPSRLAVYSRTEPLQVTNVFGGRCLHRRTTPRFFLRSLGIPLISRTVQF